MAMYGASFVVPCAGGDIEMIVYITYGIGLAAISAGATAVWAGLRYFLAQRSGGDMTSGMHILNLALIGASARVLIGVQFLLVAKYRGFGPDDGANLWPGIAAIISFVVAQVYAQFLRRNGAVPLQNEHSRSRRG